MSGGVDSSAVAAQLKSEGYDVIGVTLQLYDHGAALAKKGACCAGVDIHDARRVASDMGFPHYVLDYENIFRDAVIEEFADSYLSGATPVPCIRCNERVKFKDLLETPRIWMRIAWPRAIIFNARWAQMVPSYIQQPMPTAIKAISCFHHTGTIGLSPLSLGHLPSKDATRALAAEHGLIVADKPIAKTSVSCPMAITQV